jgi:hypothetical protein
MKSIKRVEDVFPMFLCVAIIMNKKTTLLIALDAIIPACTVTNYKLQEQ